MINHIYLDYNATTPCDPEVIEAMLPFFGKMYGNASSKHHPFGWEAKKAVDIAREQIANLIGCNFEEVIFTSGATESLNLAIKGLQYSYKSKGNHFITIETEHSAVLDTFEFLEKNGTEVDYLPVNENGEPDLNLLQSMIRKDTVAICAMWANNETGVINDIEQIAKICKKNNVFLIVDATQTAGKIPITQFIKDIDLLAISSHKMYGPKGIGALYINKSKYLKISPIIHGGGHENNLRSGTLNVSGIVGFGKAAQLALSTMDTHFDQLKTFQSHIEKSLLSLPATKINGYDTHRLPNTTNVLLRFVDNELLLSTFNQKIAVSTGSACSSANALPSHVLTAMGLSEAQAKSSIRISTGKYTNIQEVDLALEAFIKGVEKVRNESPKWQMYLAGHNLDEY